MKTESRSATARASSAAPIFTMDRTSDIRSELRATVTHLQTMSVRGLARMFDPREQTFAFRVRHTPQGVVQEGLSPRYTAISLLGLAQMPASTTARVLGGVSLEAVCTKLLHGAASSTNLGDVALSLLAGALLGAKNLEPVARQLEALGPADTPQPIVELAWTLTALSDTDYPSLESLRDRVAERLMRAYREQSSLFPHLVDADRAVRAHVSCFADLIYPIQALAKYATATGNRRALDISSACARHLCERQGEAGQWYWHYDYRTGAVLERYPVYAIHQDAMGPMGLFALRDAGGLDCTSAIERGLEWLMSAPELGGGSLIDAEHDLIWRKVGRRDKGKGVRYLQAAASRVHPSLRVPAVDLLFPARVIDFEDRPYHLGWLLYAWASPRASQAGSPKESA
jgi:hypothetical protein